MEFEHSSTAALSRPGLSSGFAEIAQGRKWPELLEDIGILSHRIVVVPSRGLFCTFMLVVTELRRNDRKPISLGELLLK